MTLDVPSPAVLSVRDVLEKRICRLYRFRNCPHQSTRTYARHTIREFIKMLRQIQQMHL
jgi:hypothetical protein